MPQESQVVGWPGRTLFDADGAKIGTIEDVFADERTGRPAWATVSSGLFGRKHHFVPIEQAREVHDGVAVPVAGQLVKDAPRVDQDGDLTREDERVLYRHYGLDDGEDRDDATAAATGDGAADDGPTDRDGAADDHRDRAADGDRDRTGEHRRDERDDARREDVPETHGATVAGRRDDDRTAADDRRADPLRGDDGTRVTYAHHDERTDRDDERREPVADVDDAGRRDDDHHQDDGRPAPAPAALQAEATTEARARAERERLAAEEAEHDRLTRSAPAGTTSAGERPGAGASDEHAHVLDRERAQEDLSVAPAPVAESRRERVPDAADVLPQHDATGDPASGRADQDRDAGAHAGSTETARPSAGTRLRRLVRSITPAKDDHHG